MTMPELFGLPKWLTDPEEDILAASFRYTYDADIQSADFTIDSKAVVDDTAVSLRVRALQTSRYFGVTNSLYVMRQTVDRYFNSPEGGEPKPPYFMYSGSAPYDVADVLKSLKDTYGLALGFGDVEYTFGELVDKDLSFPLKLKIRDASLRYNSDYFPVYAAPVGSQPLVRMVNPGRYLDGFRNHFLEPETVVGSPGEVQYFSVNATRDGGYVRRLPTGYVFNEELDSWEFGNRFLIPRETGEAVGWVASTLPRFQNVYNAKVEYNGKLRLIDVRPANPELTHTMLLRLDPKQSLRANGLIRVFYRLVDGEAIPLSDVIRVTVLDGLTYIGPTGTPLPDVVTNRMLDGLLYQPD